MYIMHACIHIVYHHTITWLLNEHASIGMIHRARLHVHVHTSLSAYRFNIHKCTLTKYHIIISVCYTLNPTCTAYTV